MFEIIFGLACMSVLIFQIWTLGDSATMIHWALPILFGVIYWLIVYLDRASKNECASPTEMIVATSLKWIARLILLGIMGFLSWLIISSIAKFVSSGIDIKTLLFIVFVSVLLFIGAIHCFIYGVLPLRGVSLSRMAYQKRKKRYHWKW